MTKKVLIIGGVAGGASAAARLRRLDEKMEIIMFERGEHISYANCGLPYYVSGVIAERDKLLVQTPEGMRERFRIDVRTKSEVTRIFPEEKVVEVQEANGHNYRESYDKLILSPGAASIRPPIPGIDDVEAFVVRNVSDIDLIKRYVDEQQPQAAVVIGGGFIGLEMAENLHARGVSTTIVEMSNQVMAPLDFEMAAILHEHIFNKGVNLILDNGVKAFDSKAGKTFITLQSGKQVQADLIILAIGVKPEIKLAKEAGLAIGDLGGIKVNEKLQTSDPNIYAIGDAIEVKHFITGQAALIPLAGPANKQGRIVADIIAGRESKYKGTQGTSIAKVFDLVVASTGANEKILSRLGIPYEVSYTHSGSNAGYYPGAKKMSVKLLFDKNGQIFGAQIVGSYGVDKRIDDIAGTIRQGGTIYDLQELELAYAPPFSSAKDPVNMAGYVAENILSGDVQIIHWHHLEKISPKDVFLVDVRTADEHKRGFIPGSIHIPIDDLRNHLSEFPQDKDIVVYCEIGLRGYLVYRILSQHGFTRVRNLSGGWQTYYPAVLS
ncbi:MAG: FAD-dependent oxidoreductase [Desulfitobacterium hafniense]|nr:FAD-dependent oxidoreductase [Desulfitobacterium hafniense]